MNIKKIAQVLSIAILVLILLVLIVGIFNPFNLRNKFIAGIINNMLSDSSEIEQEQPTNTEKNGEIKVVVKPTITDHPLLNPQQEKTLVDLGVDVSKIPTSVSPELQSCLINAVGESRANEIIAGSAPSALEILKAQSCL